MGHPVHENENIKEGSANALVLIFFIFSLIGLFFFDIVALMGAFLIC